MNITAVLGWSSAAVLVATIVTQVVRQHRAGSIAGVSPWLYCGQALASTGLCVYSTLLSNWVFAVLNAAMTTVALVGLTLWLKTRREAPSSRSSAA